LTTLEPGFNVPSFAGEIMFGGINRAITAYGCPKNSYRLCSAPEAQNSLGTPSSLSRNQRFGASGKVLLIAQLAEGLTILESRYALDQTIVARWGGVFFRLTDEHDAKLRTR
jgi:hypothetical protein